MKKLLALVIIICCVFSCKKKDDDNTPNPITTKTDDYTHDTIGKWILNGTTWEQISFTSNTDISLEYKTYYLLGAAGNFWEANSSVFVGFNHDKPTTDGLYSIGGYNNNSVNIYISETIITPTLSRKDIKYSIPSTTAKVSVKIISGKLSIRIPPITLHDDAGKTVSFQGTVIEE